MDEPVNNITAKADQKVAPERSGVKRLFRNIFRFLFKVVFYPLCGIKSMKNQKIV